jgi:proline iminopeptidase
MNINIRFGGNRFLNYILMKSIISIIFFFATIVAVHAQEVNSFVASDGETLQYTKAGNGPKVVFLYGGPGYAVSAMRPWADSLSDEFECILFDQRGTGLSSNVTLDTKTINLKRATQDLDDLRIHLNENKLTLCGISWGGMLAQAYAAYFPNKTRKIILVSTLGPDLNTMSAFTDNMNMRRFPDERDSLKYWQNQPNSDYARMKRSFYSYIPEFYNHAIGYKMLEVFFATTTYHRQMSSLMWRDLSRNYDLKLILRNYKGESIIIRPRQDPVPAEAIYQIKDILPQTRIYRIEKCGHFPDYEKPEEFFKILREVL